MSVSAHALGVKVGRGIVTERGKVIHPENGYEEYADRVGRRRLPVTDNPASRDLASGYRVADSALE